MEQIFQFAHRRSGAAAARARKRAAQCVNIIASVMKNAHRSLDWAQLPHPGEEWALRQGFCNGNCSEMNRATEATFRMAHIVRGLSFSAFCTRRLCRQLYQLGDAALRGRPRRHSWRSLEQQHLARRLCPSPQACGLRECCGSCRSIEPLLRLRGRVSKPRDPDSFLRDWGD